MPCRISLKSHQNILQPIFGRYLGNLVDLHSPFQHSPHQLAPMAIVDIFWAKVEKNSEVVYLACHDGGKTLTWKA